MFEVLLRGGRIVDGSGGPWYRGDVGIEKDRITAIGCLRDAAARVELDVTGRLVCPGFVDTHVHGDLAVLADPQQLHALRQGVTTYIVGQDGCGFAPASPRSGEYMRQYTAGFSGLYPSLPSHWPTVDEYLHAVHRRTAVNVACLIPNGTVRLEAMALQERPPTREELRRMLHLVRTGMEQGAVGLSTGLDYIPSLYADTAEIAELCKAIAPYDGVYVSHVRAHRGTKMAEAIDEVFAIARQAGCAAHISHFNVRAEEHLWRVDSGRAEGLEITFDTYPYLAGMTILAMVALPDWAQAGGVEPTLVRLADPEVRRAIVDWHQTPKHPPDAIFLAGIAAEEDQNLEGLSLKAAAERRGTSVGELVCDLLLASRLAIAVVAFDRRRTDADLVACMRHSCQMGCSDGIYFGSRPHPRGYGAFAKFVGEFVRDKQAWTIEEAIRHLAYHPCRRFRLPHRGLVAVGQVADLVVLDPMRVADRATYEDPKELAVGVEHVLVAGKLALRNEQPTGILNGHGLRRSV